MTPRRFRSLIVPNLLIGLPALLAAQAGAGQPPPPPTSTPHQTMSVESRGVEGNPVLRVQVLLDRAGFSPGEIDGVAGENTRRAIASFAKASGLGDTASMSDVEAQLSRDARDTLVPYTITEADVAGPFVADIPDDLAARAALPSLAFRTVIEALGERFHASPELLRQLNPQSRFTEGERIRVPNVTGRPTIQSGGPVRLEVTKAASTLRVYDGDTVVFSAPVTSGSEHDPLPIGEWTVTGVARNPKFHYNPDLFWDAEPGDEKTLLPAGPNNPVGVVWIDLSKDHYGLHGTPEPGTVGHTASHGCVRLTNWDAATVASLVSPGTVVVFKP